MPTASNALPIAQGSSPQALSNSKKVPRWVPISLLAVSTVALVAPILLLRRYRANALARTLQEAPPPPRRTTTAAAVTSAANVPPPHQPAASKSGTSEAVNAANSESIEDFNGALYSAKAFGYATFMVVAGASLTVWGVKSYMGVQDTEEFAHRMRSLVLTRMPGLSARIYRAREETSDDTSGSFGSSDITVVVDEGAGRVQWNWPDAEKRLTTAFELGGFSGWASAVLQELEAEGEIERKKRGHS